MGYRGRERIGDYCSCSLLLFFQKNVDFGEATVLRFPRGSLLILMPKYLLLEILVLQI